MDTLVIPDIHTKYEKAQRIIEKYKFDEVVCLGDYFDDFYDNPKVNKKTAEWLKEFVRKENCIALFGNHEFNYLYNKKIDLCSGYSSSKNWKINHILSFSDWNQLKYYYYTQGWYLTHAGISFNVYCHPIKGFCKEFLNDLIKEQITQTSIGCKGPLNSVGHMRGDTEDSGGLLWCHFPDEFKSIPGVKQVFGHTPAQRVRKTDLNEWCIDTHLNHVAMIRNGSLQIRDVTNV